MIHEDPAAEKKPTTAAPDRALRESGESRGPAHREPTRETEIDPVAARLEGQLTFLRQQMVQLFTVLENRIEQHGTELRKELRRLQTGGPQQLFRDLLEHMNQLDELVADAEPSEADDPWQQSFRVARDRYQTILGEWGLEPIAITVEKEPFNPEIHESVEDPGEGEIPPQLPPNTVARVCRRGWALHGHILQHPCVVVS